MLFIRGGAHQRPRIFHQKWGVHGPDMSCVTGEEIATTEVNQGQNQECRDPTKT